MKRFRTKFGTVNCVLMRRPDAVYSLSLSYSSSILSLTNKQSLEWTWSTFTKVGIVRATWRRKFLMSEKFFPPGGDSDRPTLLLKNFIPPIYNILVIHNIFMVRTNLPVLLRSPDGHLVRALAWSKIILVFRCEGSQVRAPQ